ncbi:hypothetical protein PR048_012070 [Dryococelus australis]|uniref:Transposase n=1 Tax=Dryococelus australis TaxID=614101 RepID=A0ABQ9HNZ0_9NEOP|nr:hypothetical protein PR048_012070 [Dryococelus australis]
MNRWKKIVQWLEQKRKLPKTCKNNDLDKAFNKNFKAFNGWLAKFKSWWNLTILNVCGEEAGVDSKILESWQPKLDALCAGYSVKNIYNADEAGVFYNLLPDRTLGIKGQTCHGGKKE